MIIWQEKLKQHISENNDLMADLRLVRSLELPQCYIAAGYIRNYVWDLLHGYDYRSEHSDIDVVYYDPDDCSESRDLEVEQYLIQTTSCSKWSVKNQARMHVRNHDEPYPSTWGAISKWPETATAVGARINASDELEICAPYGLEDLFGLLVRRCPLFDDKDYFMKRFDQKKWLEKWPMLKVICD